MTKLKLATDTIPMEHWPALEYHTLHDLVSDNPTISEACLVYDLDCRQTVHDPRTGTSWSIQYARVDWQFSYIGGIVQGGYSLARFSEDNGHVWRDAVLTLDDGLLTGHVSDFETTGRFIDDAGLPEFDPSVWDPSTYAYTSEIRMPSGRRVVLRDTFSQRSAVMT